MNNKLLIREAFSLLWLADTVLTMAFVDKHGLAAEANPLMRAVIEHGGMHMFMLVKLAVLALYLSVSRHMRMELHIILCAIMVLVVCMGVGVLL